MALIKHNHAVDIAKAAVVLDLGDLHRQGQLMIQAARDQAAAVIADAKAERTRIMQGAAEAGRLEGFEKGRAAGLIAGTEEGRKTAIAEMGPQLQKLETAWTTALTGFEAGRASMIYAAERDLMRLALKIAERIVKKRIAADPEAVLAQFRAVLDVIVRPTSLVLRVHPEDAKVLRDALPKLASQASMVKHVELFEDAALERGSCVASMRGAQSEGRGNTADAETGASGGGGGGEIDASISVQLQRLTEALLPGDQPVHT
jgi:flagellar biosynthesis/type III secretory pathway protein FliH